MKPCLLALLTGLCLALPAAGADEKRPPNFIVIFCDNLGYGDIEPFGSTLHRTPHLNRMAEEGRKFTHFCVTAGVCTPSRASLISGCYSQRVSMHHNPRDYHVLRPVSPYGLNPDEVTIAEALQEQGYKTGMIGKWHLGDQEPFLPHRQGFDFFFGVPYSDDMTERIWNQDGSHWPPLPLMRNDEVIEAPVDRNGLTKRYTEVALDWIEENRDEPFFLYIPQAMPGSTSEPFSSEEFRGKSRNGPWGDSIEELDWSTGRILDHLVKLGIEEDTLVIWTSDNGAPIRPEPGNLTRGSNLPLHGRGYTTSEGAFRVPTIIWQPGTIPAGTVCEELTTTMDLLPTFVSMAGGKIEDGVKRDGYDVTGLYLGEEGAETPYEYFAYYYLNQLQAIRSGPWKLFVPLENFPQHPHYTKKTQTNGPLLFHLYDDVACDTNVADQHPDTVAKLMGYAEEMRKDLGDHENPGPGIRPPGKVKNPVPVVKLK
jgi:arylsulfatase A-like enzyme